jgi:hypothetical protein
MIPVKLIAETKGSESVTQQQSSLPHRTPHARKKVDSAKYIIELGSVEKKKTKEIRH